MLLAKSTDGDALMANTNILLKHLLTFMDAIFPIYYYESLFGCPHLYLEEINVVDPIIRASTIGAARRPPRSRLSRGGLLWRTRPPQRRTNLLGRKGIRPEGGADEPEEREARRRSPFFF